MADAIRAKEKLEVGDMETFRIRVDGLIHHNRTLKIEHPDVPGKIMTAQVRDPAFAEGDNVYTRAGMHKSLLDVHAKPSRKQDGSLYTIYILDAAEVADDDAT